MAEVTNDLVLDTLRTLRAPGGEGDIVSLGIVSGIFIADGKVFFSLNVPAERAREMEPLREQAESTVKAIPGVKSVMVALTAEKKAGSPAPRPTSRAGGHSHSHPQAAPAKPGIPGVKHIIAVASGKGGVGKSTTAVNIAVALAELGLAVGILDADVYGPSLPRLLGLKGRPEVASGRVLKPMHAHGAKAMSMGFMVDEDTPVVWRGPMVMQALTQMLREVEWGELDVLVVDMPPGTGDAQLTMAQQVPLAGAIIVSTPQDLALIDARKGLAMFQKVAVPVIGIVENMSYFVCPDCGGRHDIFGHGGAKADAERLGVPFLGEIPLEMAIRVRSDAGTPIVSAEPGSVSAAAFGKIAMAIRDTLEAGPEKAAPKIVFE
jgi:ATP-binding protein involved in chromosome partitioning